ncbi:hypothetical protein Gpo141_00010087, partial [Globisporangium polare]
MNAISTFISTSPSSYSTS